MSIAEAAPGEPGLARTGIGDPARDGPVLDVVIPVHNEEDDLEP